MTGEDKGVWSATVKKLASGTAYSYKLTFADGTVNTSSDPYATAAVANGERSVVLSKEDMGSAGASACRPSARPLTPPSRK